jgi:hypothetical protein
MKRKSAPLVLRRHPHWRRICRIDHRHISRTRWLRGAGGREDWSGWQVGITQALDKFPGFDEGVNGVEFSEHMGRQMRRFSGEILLAQKATSNMPDGPYLRVDTSERASLPH